MADIPNIGHNNPPSALETLKQYLVEETKDHAERAKSLMDGVDRMPEKIEDDKSADDATAFYAQIQAILKTAKECHTVAKKPYLEGGRVVDKFFKDEFTDPLDRAKKLVDARLSPYLNAKRIAAEEAARKERAEAEEKARLATEAARKLAEEGMRFAAEEAAIKAQEYEQAAEKVKAPSGPVIRSDLGASSGVTTRWDFEIEDISAIQMNIIWPYLKPEDIERAVARYVRDGGRKLQGVRIFETTKLNVSSR